MDDFQFVTIEQEQERGRQAVLAQAVAGQLAWDRFAAAAPLPPPGNGVGWNAAEYAAMAAEFADAMMLERAKRLTPRKG